jgi:hypothetical protein
MELIGILVCMLLLRVVWPQTRRDIYDWQSYSNRTWSKREISQHKRGGTFE